LPKEWTIYIKRESSFENLKPENIGFDEEGALKIFDFGLAREIHTIINFEGIVGSLRYMAPEVARGKGIYLSSDVYSFGVLLHELCTLEKPFKQVKSFKKFSEAVVENNLRPSLSTIRSGSLRQLIAECWDSDHQKRPKFKGIISTLCRVIDESEGSDKLFKHSSDDFNGPVKAAMFDESETTAMDEFGNSYTSIQSIY